MQEVSCAAFTTSSTSVVSLGFDPGSSGTVSIDGTDGGGTASTWTHSGGSIYVGERGTGVVEVKNGGKFITSSPGGVYLGESAGSTGTVTVDGAGSEWTHSTGGLRIGNRGTGAVTVTDGGVVDNTSSMVLGFVAGSTGTLSLGGGAGGTVTGDVLAGSGGAVLNVRENAAIGGNLTMHNQKLNFFLPTTMGTGGTMLTVGGAADLSGSTVKVGIEGGSSPLGPGDEVVLIAAGSPVSGPAGAGANGQGMHGVTLLYDFDILVRGNDLVARVSDIRDAVRANPRLKPVSEGRLAGLALVNQGADLIIGPGMYGMLAAANDVPRGGLVPFAAGQGGRSRYNTGSHIDVSGASAMAGLAWRQPAGEGAHGSFLAGAFFEAGRGGYDSHNSFTNAASVKGDGDISYYGGGVLGRYDAMPAGPGTVYADASFRAGRVNTDFSSSDLVDGAGRKTEYDSGSAYYGAHAGLGYLWNVTDRASLDLSTKYIWTRQDGDSVRVLGDPVRFKAVDSHRWRTGARFAYAVNAYVAPYAGAYYDHEFDGTAKADTNGYRIDAPDLTGGTGVGEAGLTIKPVAGSGFSLDLGVQGYTGVREGVTGSVRISFEF